MEKNRPMDAFWGMFREKPVLVTGHTGFKGSWLALWLDLLGARVIGYSTSPPTQPNHFEVCRIGQRITDVRGDVLDFENLLSVFSRFAPQTVFHLAAQPIVRQAYEQPRETFLVNVQGTVNVLEAARQTDSVRSVLVVTSDKCYRNAEWDWSYRETDELGGFEPYGASKACAELVAAVYQDVGFQQNARAGHSFAVATARAGNVIGGGDWARDRIVTDIVSSIVGRRELVLRHPQATRPWQHVLDALSGYLSLAVAVDREPNEFKGPWNFGPLNSKSMAVEPFVRAFLKLWPSPEALVRIDSQGAAGEHRVLQLDSSKAAARLGWQPAWDLTRTLDATVQWYRKFETDRNPDMAEFSISQIDEYFAMASRLELNWATGEL